jgi:hypothetical protein
MVFNQPQQRGSRMSQAGVEHLERLQALRWKLQNVQQFQLVAARSAIRSLSPAAKSVSTRRDELPMRTDAAVSGE